jgi:hypothetical protein
VSDSHGATGAGNIGGPHQAVGIAVASDARRQVFGLQADRRVVPDALRDAATCAVAPAPGS